MTAGRRLRILTWHVHGSYLYYLGRVGHDLWVPVRDGRPPGYAGLPAGPFPWPETLHEVAADDVRRLPLDCILYQSRAHWERADEILSPEQRRLPRVFLEHDPPREHPTDTRHPVDDPDVLLVHVTHFNALMWDAGRTPTRVVEHGVVVPDGLRHTGELARGLVVVNNLARRGRRLGADVFARARAAVPLDLVGMASEDAGGLGDVPHDRLPAFEVRYRFFFNPIRYTSLGLAVCEAMMLGMPIVGLATTEMATTIEHGRSGCVATDVARLVDSMRMLLADRAEARRLGEGARRAALDRFHIDRFARDWRDVFETVARGRASVRAAG
jgi:glycosyltransferase involved in cell wall biosynthesis